MRVPDTTISGVHQAELDLKSLLAEEVQCH